MKERIDMGFTTASLIQEYLDNDATTTERNAYNKLIPVLVEARMISTIYGTLLRVKEPKMFCNLVSNICSEFQGIIKFDFLAEKLDSVRKFGLKDTRVLDRLWNRYKAEGDVSEVAPAIKMVAKLRPMVRVVLDQLVKAYPDDFDFCDVQSEKHQAAPGVKRLRIKPGLEAQFMFDSPVDVTYHLEPSSGGLIENSVNLFRNMTFRIDPEMAKIMVQLLEEPEEVQIELFGGGNKLKAQPTIENLRVAMEHYQDRGDKPFHSTAIVDFRGRISQVGPLSFVGSKPAKSLLRAGTKKPLGPTGYKWLVRGLAGAMGMDKATWLERDGLEDIEGLIMLGRMALKNPVQVVRHLINVADNAWKALSFAIELGRAHNHKGRVEDFESDILVPVDACSSGAQHMGFIMRNRHMLESTNVLATDGTVQDLYGYLSQAMTRLAAKDSYYAGLSDKLKRKISKPLVMVTLYGGTQQTNKANIKGVLITMEQDPIHTEDIYNLFAAALDTDPQFSSVKDFITLATRQAKACTDKNEHLTWTVDIGMGTPQTYTTEYTKSENPQQYRCIIDGKLYKGKSYGLDKGNVTPDVQVINKSKTKTAAAPNYIHSLDATWLHAAVVKMNEYAPGYAVGETHDCLAFHPADMDTFINKVVPEVWSMMYLEQNELAGFELSECDFDLTESLYSFC